LKALLQAILREIFGLFVDDGRLAIGAVLIVLAAALLIRLGLDAAIMALVLTLALIGLVVENIWRSARERTRPRADEGCLSSNRIANRSLN
jgi:hypothetical protein